MPRKKTGGRKGGKKSFSSLEQLFGSKTRFSLLKIFFQNRERTFFLRELARTADSQLNAIRREVANLSDIGLVEETEEKDNKKKFYKLNKNFVLLEEMGQLIGKANFLAERRFVKYMNDIGDIRLCILTGSLLNTEAPCDILVVGRVNKENLAKLVEKFEKEIGKTIVYTVFSPEEYMHRKALTDKFLFSIIEGKKVVALDKLDEFAGESARMA